jgi:hypothetical protein
MLDGTDFLGANSPLSIAPKTSESSYPDPASPARQRWRGVGQAGGQNAFSVAFRTVL